MLKFLSINNLAVIENLQIDFKENLNVISGETGAGKSILVDALALLLGARAATDLIRTGAERALVEGSFEFGDDVLEKIRSLLEQFEVEVEEGKIFIRREIHVANRSRLFINDQIANLAALKAIAPHLVEIHGQGEQYALGAAGAQMKFLDDFAGCQDLRRQVAQAYAEWKAAGESLEEFRRKVSEHARAGEVVAYQLRELETVAPRPGEDEELAAEKALLANAEKAFELSHNAYAELYETDKNVIERLSLIKRRVQDLAAIDPRVAQNVEALEAAILTLTDVAESFRGYHERIDFSPARLDRLEERLAELERLKRKYNLDLAEIIELKGDLQQRRDEMSDATGRMEAHRAELAEASQNYRELAGRLTKERRAAAFLLERKVETELAEVAMGRTRFVIGVTTAEERAGDKELIEKNGADDTERVSGACYWTANGADNIEFLISVNEGESVRPLSRVASGGELSRLMLTLHTVCRVNGAGGAGDEEPTLVFDEIDAGVSGRVAEAVGQRLRALAARRQILCVTHQAQIARFAKHHFVVSKNVKGGRTFADIKELNDDERIGELARLIGGAEDVTTARETARWLLESAESAEKVVVFEKRKGKARRK